MANAPDLDGEVAAVKKHPQGGRVLLLIAALLFWVPARWVFGPDDPAGRALRGAVALAATILGLGVVTSGWPFVTTSLIYVLARRLRTSAHEDIRVFAWVFAILEGVIYIAIGLGFAATAIEGAASGG